MYIIPIEMSRPICISIRMARMISPEPNSGCHLWLGSVTEDGYGLVTHGATALAHRIAYEMEFGPIPAGLVIDHKCRVRSCVNTDHLQAVTQAQNVQNIPRVQRNECRRGHSMADAYIWWQRGRMSRSCRTCMRDNSARKRELRA